jgi:Homeodomain-like domain
MRATPRMSSTRTDIRIWQVDWVFRSLDASNRAASGGKVHARNQGILGIGSNETLGKALRGEPPPEWTRRPRAKDERHAKARELRAQGRTYKEIAAELGVSKSSVSLWVRDLPRPGRLSYDVTFINSDPKLILFFLRFLHAAGVEPDRLVCRVYIHETADVVGSQQFWLELTGLKPEQFRRPVLKHHNPKTVRKNTGNDYHGCLVIDVQRSADLYRRIEGWAAVGMAHPRGSMFTLFSPLSEL